MIVNMPLLAASCITQLLLPNSRCQEYQIAGEIISFILGVGYLLCGELKIDVVGGEVETCLGEQNVEIARDCERVIKLRAAAVGERHYSRPHSVDAITIFGCRPGASTHM